MSERVLIADALEESGLRMLADAGIPYDVRTGLAPEALAAAVAEGYTALVVRSASKVTRAVLEAGRSLRIVGRAGVGVDNIDVGAASERGVLVVNAPEGNTIAAAEHTLALLLALARHVPESHASLRAGRWERKAGMGVELHGKTVGVVGLGKIGRTVAARCKSFGMEVLGYDPFVSPDMCRSLGVASTELPDLFARADFVTLHVPLTDETKGLIGLETLARVKPGVRIVNCARGGLVDEAALAAALRDGRVAGAALDVFSSEPPAADCPLLRAPNVVLTPHLGASTLEAQTKVGLEVVEQVIEYLTTGVIRSAINAPALPPDVARILGPYMDLAMRLGKLQAQLMRGHLVEIHVRYNGDFAQHSTRPITTALLAGFLSCVTDEPVNLVNAELLVKRRGIQVDVTTSNDDVDYARLVSVTFVTDGDRRLVAGTLLGGTSPRIVRMDGYDFDAVPSGHMLLVSNIDKAGVVGSIGSIMGRHGINIAGMSLGRDTPAGRALAIINVDSEVPTAMEQELLSQEHVLWVRAVRL